MGGADQSQNLVPTFPLAYKSQALAAFFAVSCLLAGVRSYSTIKRSESPCYPLNPFAWCLEKVDFSSSDSEFCRQSREAIGCISHVLRRCYRKNDPDLLDDLTVVDFDLLYDKRKATCH
ncbi:hypothetical protein RRG08_048158 [Elysia crispata]|uniref:Uncharacterized protein n=1 Tax=Elysia crispata TaxID=231223 RepID=A0AAE1DHT0_9GAST|nr:hypothetical protein RRG08_048158 [Elysia crispata]